MHVKNSGFHFKMVIFWSLGFQAGYVWHEDSINKFLLGKNTQGNGIVRASSMEGSTIYFPVPLNSWLQTDGPIITVLTFIHKFCYWKFPT